MSIVWKDIELNPRYYRPLARARWGKLSEEGWNASYSRERLIARLNALYAPEDMTASVDAWLAALSPAPSAAITIGGVVDKPA